MDDKQMLYFLQVCEHGNLTKASQNLYISQQALSAAIQRLEQELGVPLFERTKHGMKLTKYGVYAKSQIDQIDLIRHNMQKNLDQMKAGDHEILRIGVSFGVISSLPDHFLDSFEKQHPEIEIHFQEYTDLKCEKAVLDGTVDLGFNIAPINQDVFQSRTIIQDYMCILINEKNKLSQKKRIRFEELRNESFLLLTNEFKIRQSFVMHCRKAGFEPKIVLETMELILIHNFSRLNKGIGVSVYFIADDLSNVCAIPFEEECKWEVCLITDRHRRLSLAAQAFWDYVNSMPCYVPSDNLPKFI